MKKISTVQCCNSDNHFLKINSVATRKRKRFQPQLRGNNKMRNLFGLLIKNNRANAWVNVNKNIHQWEDFFPAPKNASKSSKIRETLKRFKRSFYQFSQNNFFPKKSPRVLTTALVEITKRSKILFLSFAGLNCDRQGAPSFPIHIHTLHNRSRTNHENYPTNHNSQRDSQPRSCHRGQRRSLVGSNLRPLMSYFGASTWINDVSLTFKDFILHD